MIGRLRALMTGALIGSFLVVQTPLLASTEGDTSTTPAPAQGAATVPTLEQSVRRVVSTMATTDASAPPLRTASDTSFARGQRYGARRYGRGRRNAAMTAIVVGSAAAITGGALLAYANRPACSVDSRNDGCGYGFKVIGGSVLAGGLVGVTLGVATWPR